MIKEKKNLCQIGDRKKFLDLIKNISEIYSQDHNVEKLNTLEDSLPFLSKQNNLIMWSCIHIPKYLASYLKHV